MLSIIDLTMRYGNKFLFRNAAFQLNPGRHYALVGPNGSGKSTLIRILCGDAIPDKGNIHLSPLFKLGTLKQDHFIYEQETLVDTVMIGKTALWQASIHKKNLLQKAALSDEECQALAHCEKIIEENDGYSSESQIGALLEGLGLKSEMHMHKLHTLSGGYKLRVLLAQVLFSQPDILILDEPTNHLDLYSIKWLEDYIKQFPGIALISSHDRSFLNEIATDIIDLDYEMIKIYAGNYDQFEKAKAWDSSQKEAQLAKQAKKKEDLQEFVDRFGAKATKARQAQSKLKAVAKIENAMEGLFVPPSSRRAPQLEFHLSRPSGAIPLQINAIHKAYGDKKVLQQVSFEMEKGEKIAILGANGIGKSTLLEILTGRVSADSGSFEWGFAAGFAYFPQDHSKELDRNRTLLDWLLNALKGIPEQRVRQMLAQVLFSGDDVHKTISVLSGGEMARLILAKMMLSQQNVLIFDEPTNHLDIETIEALLTCLKAYEGSVLFVSHNRYFVSNIATRVIEINETGIHDFRCSYKEYLEKRGVDHLDRYTRRSFQVTKEPASKAAYEEQKKQRNSRVQLERRLRKAEDVCHQLELEIQKINAKLFSENYFKHSSHEEQLQLSDQKAQLEKKLERALEEWEKAHRSQASEIKNLFKYTSNKGHPPLAISAQIF